MQKFKLPPVTPNNRVRGMIHAPRNDASGLKGLIEELTNSVSEMRADYDKRLADLNDGGKPNAELSSQLETLKASLTDQDQVLAALKDEINSAQLGLGGGENALSSEARAHHSAFVEFVRTGENENSLKELQVKASLSTTEDSKGGYVVPEELERQIDRVAKPTVAMRRLARVVKMGSKTWDKIVNIGGATASWVNETAARPETSSPNLAKLTIEAHEIYANPAATQTILDDSFTNIEEWLSEEVGVAFEDKESEAFIKGSGAGQPLGLLTPEKVADADYEWAKVGYVVSGKADGFKVLDAAAEQGAIDALVDVQTALKDKYSSNATWLMNRKTLGVIRKFKDANGQLIFTPPTNGNPGTILGHPYELDDFMPDIGANSFPIAFGDFQRAYTIADRIGIRVLRDPYTNKPYVQFYTTKRVGGGVTNFEAYKLLKIAA